MFINHYRVMISAFILEFLFITLIYYEYCKQAYDSWLCQLIIYKTYNVILFIAIRVQFRCTVYYHKTFVWYNVLLLKYVLWVKLELDSFIVRLRYNIPTQHLLFIETLHIVSNWKLSIEIVIKHTLSS